MLAQWMMITHDACCRTTYGVSHGRGQRIDDPPAGEIHEGVTIDDAV